MAKKTITKQIKAKATTALKNLDTLLKKSVKLYNKLAIELGVDELEVKTKAKAKTKKVSK